MAEPIKALTINKATMVLHEFEKYLVCPTCHGALRKDENGFVCRACVRAFPVVQGVPVFLDESALRCFAEEMAGAQDMKRRYKRGVLAALIRITKKVIGSTLPLPLSNQTKRIWADRPNELRLEIGSGVERPARNQVNLDIGLFSGVNVVASGSCIPFADGTFGLVRSGAVLEHVPDPAGVVNEILRVAKSGAYVYCTVPFLQHFHAYPNDFQRYTIEGMKVLFREFEILETGVCVGPSSAVTALVADWFELFSFSQNRMLNDVVRTIPLLLLLPLKYLDYLLVKNPRAHEVASGTYILCRKPGPE